MQKTFKFVLIVIYFISVQTMILHQFAPKFDEWDEFKRNNGKFFKDDAEENERRESYFRHKKLIDEYNASFRRGMLPFFIGLNKYADLSLRRFVKIMNGLIIDSQPDTNETILDYISNYDAPDEVDWRDKGIVSPVMDQGECGSCWAVSTMGALEGQHALQTGNLVALSAQNLVDCDRNLVNQGCNGGSTDLAYEYVIKNDGVDTEKSYPYEARDFVCRFRRNKVGATASGYHKLPEGDEDMLKLAVASIGPISVGIDGNHMTFQLYRGGIYYNPFCKPKVNHAVLLIGYGTENGTDYWLIKNSWGETWGDNGYGKMIRNKNNNCGIASLANFPTI